MKKSFHCKGWKLTWLPDLSLAAVPLKVVFYHVAHDCFKSSWLILFWRLSLDQLTCAESTPTLWENSDPSSSGSERRSSKEPNLVLEVRKDGEEGSEDVILESVSFKEHFRLIPDSMCRLQYFSRAHFWKW